MSSNCTWYAYARKILLRKLFRNFSNFVTEFYLKFHREGGDLHDQILSVKTWKNKRKCQKMVLFSWKTWKMVKYFIEILSYFWPIMLILSQFSGKFSWFSLKNGLFCWFSLNFHQKWAIFSYFWAIFTQFHLNFNKGVVQDLIWFSLNFQVNIVLNWIWAEIQQLKIEIILWT